jgi:hypothetical protein
MVVVSVHFVTEEHIMKKETLQSVRAARMKIASGNEGKRRFYFNTVLLAKKGIFDKPKRKQVKVQVTHTRTFTADGNSRPQKSGLNKGFSAPDQFLLSAG